MTRISNLEVEPDELREDFKDSERRQEQAGADHRVFGYDNPKALAAGNFGAQVSESE